MAFVIVFILTQSNVIMAADHRQSTYQEKADHQFRMLNLALNHVDGKPQGQPIGPAVSKKVTTGQEQTIVQNQPTASSQPETHILMKDSSYGFRFYSAPGEKEILVQVDCCSNHFTGIFLPTSVKKINLTQTNTHNSTIVLFMRHSPDITGSSVNTSFCSIIPIRVDYLFGLGAATLGLFFYFRSNS